MLKIQIMRDGEHYEVAVRRDDLVITEPRRYEDRSDAIMKAARLARDLAYPDERAEIQIDPVQYFGSRP